MFFTKLRVIKLQFEIHSLGTQTCWSILLLNYSNQMTRVHFLESESTLSGVWRPTSFKQCHMMNGNLWPQTHFKVENQKWICGYIQKAFAISSHIYFSNQSDWIIDVRTRKFEAWTIITTYLLLLTHFHKKLYQSLLVIKALASTKSKYVLMEN